MPRRWRRANRPSRQRVDLVLGEQFLGRDLGFGAGRRLQVALDQLERVGLRLIGVELEIKLRAAFDLLRQLGADASIGQDDADLDFLRQAAWVNCRPRRSRRRLRQRPRSFVWTSKILPDFRKFRLISVGDVRTPIVGRKPEMAQAKSGRAVRAFVAQRRRIIVAARPGGLQEDISMTAWTRIGIAAIAILILSAAALAPCALVRTSAAAERALSDAQLKKIDGWIADQGRDIAVSAVITEILGLTKNDQTISARGYAALDTANGNEIRQDISSCRRAKAISPTTFTRTRSRSTGPIKDLVLLTALSGVRGARPEVMFFQDAQAGIQQ